MSPEELKETIERLDNTYPNGWRCGHAATDNITITMAYSLNQMITAILKRK